MDFQERFLESFNLIVNFALNYATFILIAVLWKATMQFDPSVPDTINPLLASYFLLILLSCANESFLGVISMMKLELRSFEWGFVIQMLS